MTIVFNEQRQLNNLHHTERSINTATVSSSMAVAIINHNTSDLLRSCLASVVAEAPDEIVVVDNASTDDSVRMVRGEFPQVILHASEQNSGYGAGANQAFAHCKSSYVLVLNSDTLLEHGAIRALTTYLDTHPTAALVGPRLVYPNGTLQHSCFNFPTPAHALLRETVISILIGYIPFLRELYLPTWSHSQERVVPWVLGAALAIRRSAFEQINGFDESFFMYSEEVDLSYRFKQAGWQTHFAPVTNIVHIRKASTRKKHIEMGVQLYKSTQLFYRHHYARWQFWLLTLILRYSMVRNITRDTLRLYRVRDPEQRQKMQKDIVIWKRVLGEIGHNYGH